MTMALLCGLGALHLGRVVIRNDYLLQRWFLKTLTEHLDFAAAQNGDKDMILYDPAAFAVMCEEATDWSQTLVRNHDSLAKRVIILPPLPDNDSGCISLMLFIPNHHGALSKRFYWDATVTCAVVVGESWPCKIYPVEGAIVAGAKGVDEFFSTADELWRAASEGDLQRLQILRKRTGSNDVYIGEGMPIDGRSNVPVKLSGRQLDALAEKLEQAMTPPRQPEH